MKVRFDFGDEEGEVSDGGVIGYITTSTTSIRAVISIGINSRLTRHTTMPSGRLHIDLYVPLSLLPYRRGGHRHPILGVVAVPFIDDHGDAVFTVALFDDTGEVAGAAGTWNGGWCKTQLEGVRSRG